MTAHERATKRLLLMRHADAGPYEPGADHERPLVPQGRSDATLVGERLRAVGAQPDLVVCSTAARTRETLERILAAIGRSAPVRHEPRVYGAPTGTLLDVVQEVDDAVGTLMLVGHNPGTHALAVTLAERGRQLDELASVFPPGSVADLRLACAWGDVAPGTAELVAFITPRELR